MKCTMCDNGDVIFDTISNVDVEDDCLTAAIFGTCCNCGALYSAVVSGPVEEEEITNELSV